MLACYLDEHASERLTEVLGRLGHDATSANRLRRKGLSDALHLLFAAESNRVLICTISSNPPFSTKPGTSGHAPGESRPATPGCCSSILSTSPRSTRSPKPSIISPTSTTTSRTVSLNGSAESVGRRSPERAPDNPAHTSITIGRIIGRRRVSRNKYVAAASRSWRPR